MTDLNRCEMKCRKLFGTVEAGHGSYRCRWDDKTTLQLACEYDAHANRVVINRHDKCAVLLAEKAAGS